MLAEAWPSASRSSVAALPRKRRVICVGRIITGAHGVRGWVRMKSFTAEPEAIAAYGPLEDESGARRFAVELVGAGKGVVAGADRRASRIATRPSALKGLRLYRAARRSAAARGGRVLPGRSDRARGVLEDGTRFGTVRGGARFRRRRQPRDRGRRPARRVVVPFTTAPRCRWSISPAARRRRCRQRGCSMRRRAQPTKRKRAKGERDALDRDRADDLPGDVSGAAGAFARRQSAGRRDLEARRGRHPRLRAATNIAPSTTRRSAAGRAW